MGPGPATDAACTASSGAAGIRRGLITAASTARGRTRTAVAGRNAVCSCTSPSVGFSISGVGRLRTCRRTRRAPFSKRSFCTNGFLQENSKVEQVALDVQQWLVEHPLALAQRRWPLRLPNLQVVMQREKRLVERQPEHYRA